MSFNNLILLETETYKNFYPFSIMHPVWELRCGALRLFEKAKLQLPDTKLRFIGRDAHVKSFLKRFGLDNDLDLSGSALILNSQVIPNEKLFSHLKGMKENTKIICKDKLIGLYLTDVKEFKDEMNLENVLNFSVNTEIINEFDCLNYIYEALDFVGNEISNDLELLTNEYKQVNPEDYQNAFFIDPENVYVKNNVKIAPGAVIDASEGKVLLGENVKIMPQATIIGAVSIGDNSTIKIGAKIYENSCFGEWCKVGGEIENTIIQAYSNKQHEGFLGHSFISEWVNLGADTNNSDLKNTYGNIKIRMEDRIIDTERMFLGLLCGDHTKSSINAMFTTGTVSGICGIVVREWFMPSYIRSFTWGGKTDSPVYKFNKAVETAKIVMNRRNKELSEEEIYLMKLEYDKVNK